MPTTKSHATAFSRLAWITVALAAGCSDEVTSSGADAATQDIVSPDATSDIASTPDNPTPADVARDLPAAEASVVDAPTADVSATPGDCPADRICLRTEPRVPGGAIAAGRLAVVWIQLNDDGPDPLPQVAYDVPFEGGARRIEIPRAMIALPMEPLQLCTRMCNDESMCPCTGEPRVGIGLVALAADTNGNGRVDITNSSSTSETLYGGAYMTVGWSQRAVPTPSTDFGMLYPEGIQEGIAPYRIIPGVSGFDRQGLPAPGQVFVLSVCPYPAIGSCRALSINLT